MAPQHHTLPVRPGRMAHIKPSYRKKPKENILGITRPSIRRLARRGGVIRMKREIYDEVRGVIKERLSQILSQVAIVLESAQTPRHDRKTVTTPDVVYALNRMGNPVYGFGTA